MKTKFVRFFTQDGVELQGLYFSPSQPSTRRGVLHVHGLAGNFYENRFIDQMADKYTKRGYSLFVFNNRGHDYLTDLLKKTDDGWSYILGGGAYEDFSESVLDIDAAIQFMSDQGVEKVVLQGHSSGANKVVYYQNHRKNEIILALILLSPCDDIGLQIDAKGDNFEDVMNTAHGLVEQGKGQSLMPEGSFSSYPISAINYIDYFSPDSNHDIFPYREPNSEFERLSKIEVPIMALFGNAGESVLGDVEETLALLKEKAISSSQVYTTILEGAPHNYLGYENELTNEISSWLDEISKSENSK